MTSQGKWALSALLVMLALAGCGGIADEFLPNSEGGQLQITVERGANVDQDHVSEAGINERLRFMRSMLARSLPAGVEVHVAVAASGFGVYRFGGGWITRGDLYLGRHAVPTELVEVVSSNIGVLAAEIVPGPTNPVEHLAKLTTLKPGQARVSFRIWRLDEERQRIGGLIEDSFALHVGERPGDNEGAAPTLQRSADNEQDGSL